MDRVANSGREIWILNGLMHTCIPITLFTLTPTTALRILHRRPAAAVGMASKERQGAVGARGKSIPSPQRGILASFTGITSTFAHERGEPHHLPAQDDAAEKNRGLHGSAQVPTILDQDSASLGHFTKTKTGTRDSPVTSLLLGLCCPATEPLLHRIPTETSACRRSRAENASHRLIRSNGEMHLTPSGSPVGRPAHATAVPRELGT